MADALILFRMKLPPIGHFIVKVLPSLIFVVIPLPATVIICPAYEPELLEMPLGKERAVVVKMGGYAKPFDVSIFIL